MIFRTLAKSRITHLILIYYLIIFVFWLKIRISGQVDEFENYFFNVVYGGIALIGGIQGLILSFKKWGGYSSMLGRGIMLFSIGLLGEWFGNIVWGYTNIVLKISVPYPGLADLGFFSIIPLYGWGMIEFARASGVSFTLKTFKGQVQAIAIPFVMVFVSWALFLRGIPLDISDPLKLFLDFGYPGGEAITVSLAILTYSL